MRRLFALLLLCPCLSLWAAAPPAVHARNGMIASRSTLASEAGVSILRAGGNAIDAAVATGFALAVTYPSAGNIGGGGFVLLRLADGKVVALDHRERAPSKAHRDMFLDDKGEVVKDLSRASHLASGVPGSVDGLLELLERYGSRSRQEVMAPAIRLAQEGFILDRDLAEQFADVLPDMQSHPGSVAAFSRKGVAYQEGERWQQPDLANTLQRIAQEGRAGFYEGQVAGLITDEMKRGGGLISREDLAAYRSVWREPVRGEYRGYVVWGMPPPSSGGVLVLQMLNMLEPFDLKAMGWGSAATVHLMVEAERRAYADRAQYLGDPDQFEVPVAQLTSREYARTRFADFDPAKATPSESIGPGVLPSESPETTHFSVMDKAGNAVAFTTTLNSGYGNKIVVRGAGFLLNNEMDDFSIKEDTANQFGLLGRQANAIAPGKRMLSSMSPTIVTRDGTPVLVTGSPGGSTIITTVLQVIVNVIDHGMGIEDAVSLPRFHHQWQPDVITHEAFGLSPDTLRLLQGMGHAKLRSFTFGRGIGDANSILVREGVMQGMKDPRNEGVAVGW